MVHCPIHRRFDAVQLSCPLSRKTPPKHNVSTSMFDGGDGVLGVIGSIPPPPNMDELMPKSLILVSWPQYFYPFLFWIIQMFIGKPQMGLYMCFLDQGGTLRALQDFSPWRRSVTNCFLGDYGSSCLAIDKILPCSSGLIPHYSHDHWNSTRWDLAWSPRLGLSQYHKNLLRYYTSWSITIPNSITIPCSIVNLKCNSTKWIKNDLIN